MTFHAYFQYVCLFIVWLCAISPTRMYAQKYRQQSDTHRTLLVVDKETGRPIEGAYILLENQPLASSTGGRIIIPWKTNSKDTVLVQSLRYCIFHKRTDKTDKRRAIFNLARPLLMLRKNIYNSTYVIFKRNKRFSRLR